MAFHISSCAAAAAALLCAFPGFSVCGAEDLRPVLRFGMMAFLQEGTPSGFTTYVNADDYVLRKLPQILSQSLPEYRVDVKVYRTASLIKAARSGKVDVIFGSSGCYASLLPDGIYPLATLVTNFAPDPNQAVAGAVVVSSRRTDLNSLKDLKHLSAMSGLESMFFNWQMPASALLDRGLDPYRFFSSLRQVDQPVPKILQALEDGTIDVGLMRACVLEGLPIERRKHFKVIEPAEDSPLACAHTSRLFPNWTVGAMSQVPSDVAKRISLALLTAPPQTEAGIAWSTANSFKSIDQLYRELKWGRYEYLRHWTFTRVWEAVWPFALAALVAFLALMLHLRRVNALVERRTRELPDAWLWKRATLRCFKSSTATSK